MATVVHHGPDKPWMEALSNAISAGSNSIVQQRMERDKLAVQISENAKQRALDSYLTGVRVRGRYLNQKLSTDATKEQWKITNANQDRLYAIQKDTNDDRNDEIDRRARVQVGDAAITALLDRGIKNRDYDLDKNGKVIVVDRGSPMYRDQAGLPSHSGLQVRTTIQEQLTELLKGKNVSPGVRKIALSYAENEKLHVKALKATVPILNGLLKTNPGMIQSWIPEVDPDTQQPYTIDDIRNNKNGILTNLAALDPTLLAQRLRSEGIEVGMTERLASVLPYTEDQIGEEGIKWAGTMSLFADGIPNKQTFGVGDNGKISPKRAKHQVGVNKAIEQWMDHSADKEKIRKNVSAITPLDKGHEITLGTSLDSVLAEFSTIWQKNGVIPKNPEKIIKALTLRMHKLLLMDQDESRPNQLIKLEAASPLDASILKLLRGLTPSVVRGEGGKPDTYSVDKRKLEILNLVPLSKEIANGWLAEKEHGIGLISILDTIEPTKSIALGKKGLDDATPVAGPPPPDEGDPDPTTIAATSDVNILSNITDPQGNIVSAGDFIKTKAFTDDQQKSFNVLTTDAEVEKVSNIINEGTNTTEKWIRQSARTVVNKIFGLPGKEYLDGLRRAELADDAIAGAKLDAWYALRRRAIMSDMTQSNKFAWLNKPIGWGFIDFLDWKIKMDEHQVIDRKWLNAQFADSPPPSAAPALEQLKFILDSYNVGEEVKPRHDPKRRYFAWDVQQLLFEIKNTQAYRQFESANANPSFYDARASAQDSIGQATRKPVQGGKFSPYTQDTDISQWMGN